MYLPYCKNIKTLYEKGACWGVIKSKEELKFKKKTQWPIANIQSLVNFKLFLNFVSVFTSDSGVARTNYTSKM